MNYTYSNNTSNISWTSTTSTSDGTYWEYKPKKYKDWSYNRFKEWEIYPWRPSKEDRGHGKSVDPREIFNEVTAIKTKDGENLDLTYGQIYEIEKMTGKSIEELTEEEIKEQLMVLEL